MGGVGSGVGGGGGTIGVIEGIEGLTAFAAASCSLKWLPGLRSWRGGVAGCGLGGC